MSSGSYWLIDTDYDNYASVYSCQSILGLFEIEYAWVLVRNTQTSEDIVTKAREAFTKNGLDISKFEIVSHENCEYDRPDIPSCNWAESIKWMSLSTLRSGINGLLINFS